MIEDEYIYDEEGEEDEAQFYAIRPNKTQIKKQIAVIHAMSEEICDLTPAQIAEFELPGRVEAALLDAAKMGKNSARKRLLKYVTAQLREIDTEAVAEKLARMKNRSAHAVREHHQAERWRDQLLAENGNNQLTLLMSEFPDADSQYLRQLQRNALKEAQTDKPPKSSRLLYKYLKELIANQPDTYADVELSAKDVDDTESDG